MWLGKINFNDGHTVKFCINYWYKKKEAHGIPLLAELTFDYDLIASKDRKKGVKWPENTVEQFHMPTVKAVQTLFSTLKKHKLVDTQGTTKTNYVYSL